MSGEKSLIKIYKQNLITLCFVYNITTDWHRHPCFQLTVSLHNISFELETKSEKKEVFGFIVQSNLLHKIKTRDICCINLFVDPESNHYHLLSHFTEKNSVYFLSSEEALKIANYFIKSVTINQPIDIYHVYRFLCKCDLNYLCNQDNRINKAVSIISLLPVKKISCREIAAEIHLSESRFLHLFRSKLGINFRSYLLWKRLQDVIDNIDSSDSSETLTTLANDKGFSDSAHFSRTCLSSFGIRPSQLRQALCVEHNGSMCGKYYCLQNIFQALYI